MYIQCTCTTRWATEAAQLVGTILSSDSCDNRTPQVLSWVVSASSWWHRWVSSPARPPTVGHSPSARQRGAPCWDEQTPPLWVPAERPPRSPRESRSASFRRRPRRTAAAEQTSPVIRPDNMSRGQLYRYIRNSSSSHTCNNNHDLLTAVMVSGKMCCPWCYDGTQTDDKMYWHADTTTYQSPHGLTLILPIR